MIDKLPDLLVFWVIRVEVKNYSVKQCIALKEK
jgi:hypothetical protein